MELELEKEMEKDQKENAMGAKGEVQKRLAALQSAGKKKRKPPSIPGSTDPNATLAKAHSSHTQATTAAAKKLIEDNGLEGETKVKAENGQLMPLFLTGIATTKKKGVTKRKKSHGGVEGKPSTSTAN